MRLAQILCGNIIESFSKLKLMKDEVADLLVLLTTTNKTLLV